MDVEKARQVFKALEMKTKSKENSALRLLCIQELLEETRKNLKKVNNYK